MGNYIFPDRHHRMRFEYQIRVAEEYPSDSLLNCEKQKMQKNADSGLKRLRTFAL
jgi:hypothetical protein